MKKSLSLLVAIAMVFSMFATLVASAAEETKLTTQQKYEALVKAGIFEGFPNGEAKLDEKMERSQAAKIISLLLGYKEGVEVKDAGFKDVDVKGQRWAIDVINYAAQLGILEGHSATRFGPADNVTVEELAQIVARVAKHAGQELAAGEAVEGKTSKWATEVVASVVSAGIIPVLDDYTVAATRGQLVDVTYPLYELTKEPDFGATQTGAKEITINFGQAVDAAKAEFVVKNGTITRTVDDVDFAEDKKSAVIKLTTKLTEGETTVTVSKATAEPVVAKFNAQTEKVTEIKYGSDKLALQEHQPVGSTTKVPNFLQVAVSYKLLNQFGEDVTKSSGGNLQFFPAKAGAKTSVKDGILTITLDAGSPQFNYNETVQITASLHMGSYAVTSQELFTVSDVSRLDDVKIVGVYNADKKELTNEFADGTFVVLVEPTDQYGNAVDADKFRAGAFATSSNPLAATIDIQNATGGHGPEGNKVGIPLKNPKSAYFPEDAVTKITVTTVFGNKSDSLDVTVKKASTLTTFSLEAPDNVATAGQPLELKFTALDQHGKAITDAEVLNNSVVISGIPADGNKYFVTNYVTKEAKLVVKPAALVNVNEATILAFSNVSGTLNNSQIQIKVVSGSKADSISGLKKDYARTIVKDGEITLKASDVVIADDYGRVIKSDDLKTNPASYKLNVTVVTPAVAALNPTATTFDLLTGDAKIKGLAKGTTTLKIELLDLSIASTSDQVISTHTSTVLTVVDSSNIKADSIQIEVSEKLYAVGLNGTAPADAKYVAPVTVKATTNSGQTVTLSNGIDYTLQGSALLKVIGNGVVANYNTGDTAKKDNENAAVQVTLNNGSIFTKDVVISKELPVATSFEASKGNIGSEVTNNTVVIPLSASGNLTYQDLFETIIVKDQYGVVLQKVADSISTVDLEKSINYTVFNVKNFTAQFTSGVLDDNASETVNPTATALKAGDEFEVRFSSQHNLKNIAVKFVIGN